MTIPLVDLVAQYHALREELDAAVLGVLAEGRFVKGPQVARFEAAFAAYGEAAHAVGVGNGTDALELALGAVGVSPGDEVVVPANTFIATAEAVSRVGASVRFADVDPDTWLLDRVGLEEQLSGRTRAVVPVHLFGNPVDLDTLLKTAEVHDLRVVEDAAQAHGARHRGRRVGAWGDAGTFSFYPGKNLGAYGDAGAVVTNRPDVAERVRLLADHGRHDKYEHLVEGRNSRLDTLQAAVLLVKLARLDAANERRRALAARYREQLVGVEGVVFPAPVEGTEPVHHLLVIAVPDRDRLRTFLGERGIATGVHYPVPLHLQPAYRHLGYGRGDLPVAERLADAIVSLPLYPELIEAQVDEVSQAVRAFLHAG